MELSVQLGVLLGIFVGDGPRHPGFELLQFAAVGIVTVVGGMAGLHALDDRANFGDLNDLVDVDIADDCAPIRRAFDETFVLQLGQRSSDRLTTNVVAFGQHQLDEAITRGILAVENVTAQLIGGRSGTTHDPYRDPIIAIG